MSDNKKEIVIDSTVVAITQEENRLRAVRLVKQGETFEVLWLKSSEPGRVDWCRFAAECGLSAELTGQTREGGNTIVVAGFNSSGVVFHRIGLPAVREEDIAAMVRLQAEARLPLPAEQMEMAWRAGGVKDGRVIVTVAAAKREYLQKFVEDVRGFQPAKIVLDCEGIVRVWREFFSGKIESLRKGVIISIGSRNIQVCLAEDGRLSNTVSLDMGMEDFAVVQGAAKATETADRFAQDIRSALELFGCTEPADVPVFVLSDGGRKQTEENVQAAGVIEVIVSSLEETGFNVRAVLPEVKKLRAKKEFEDIYEYRVPIGLALLAFDDDAKELNIFERLYRPIARYKKSRWFYSPKVTGTITAMMLILLIIVFYAGDVAGLNGIEKQLKGAKGDLLGQRQRLIKTVAQQRPDLLDLLSEINVADGKEMMLDSLHFKKGQPVRITGQANSAEDLYKFEKSLQDKKAIEDVKIQSAPEDSKSKKLKFSITFHYRNFTKKGSQI